MIMAVGLILRLAGCGAQLSAPFCLANRACTRGSGMASPFRACWSVSPCAFHFFSLTSLACGLCGPPSENRSRLRIGLSLALGIGLFQHLDLYFTLLEKDLDSKWDLSPMVGVALSRQSVFTV